MLKLKDVSYGTCQNCGEGNMLIHFSVFTDVYSVCFICLKKLLADAERLVVQKHLPPRLYKYWNLNSQEAEDDNIQG